MSQLITSVYEAMQALSTDRCQGAKASRYPRLQQCPLGYLCVYLLIRFDQFVKKILPAFLYGSDFKGQS